MLLAIRYNLYLNDSTFSLLFKLHDYLLFCTTVHWESNIKQQTIWDLRYSWSRRFRSRSYGLWHGIVWQVIADVSGKPAVIISHTDHSALTVPYGLGPLGLWCGRLEFRSGQADIPAAFICVVFCTCRHTFGLLARRRLAVKWRHK